MNIKNIFPTGIITHQVSPQIANYVEDLVVPRLKNLGFNNENYSDFFNKEEILNINEVPLLKKEIEKCINFFEKTYSIPKKTEINSYWVQDYKFNNFHGTHNHGRNEISIVYWIRANEDAGMFCLSNPSPFTDLWYSPYAFYDNSNNPYIKDKYMIQPSKGSLIAFPSFLNHEVLPGGKNCIRTTLALNSL